MILVEYHLFQYSFDTCYLAIIPDVNLVEINTESETFPKHVLVYTEAESLKPPNDALPPSELFKLRKPIFQIWGLVPGRHWFMVSLVDKQATQTYIVEAGYPLT